MHRPARRFRLALVALPVFLLAALFAGPQRLLNAALQPLRRLVGPMPGGETIVSTGQELRPAGVEITFPGRAVDAALSPDGKTLAILNSASLLLFDVDPPKLRETLPAPDGGPSFAGIAWSPDGQRLYASSTRAGIQVVSMAVTGPKLERSIAIPDVRPEPRRAARTVEELEEQPPRPRSNSAVPGGMAASRDGRRLYVALNRANTLAEIDLDSGQIARQIPVGVAPYGVALSADGRTAFVSNWGGRRPREGDTVAYSSGTGVVVDPASGVASTGTVSAVSLADGTAREIEVGLHPCSLLVSDGQVYVANAGSDTVSVLNPASGKVTATLSVHLRPAMPLGAAPIALAMVEGELVTANAGNNAIAVLDPASGRARGMLPTGWYPSAVVALAGGRRLAVLNLKGLGTRNQPPNAKGYSIRNWLGSINFINDFGAADTVRRDRLARATQEVIRNNGWDAVLAAGDAKEGATAVPVPARVGEPSPIKHVLYIIKENRTYDQVFGDVNEGNGDPTLVQFGEEVTPNHHALAREFVLLDNFYCSGSVSADGHQWTNEAYANDYLERFLGAGFPRSYPYEGSDPLAYATSGFLWDNALKHGRTFRCYGEFAQTLVEPPTSWRDFWQAHQAGRIPDQIRAATYVRSLKPSLHPKFPGFAMGIPDQTRADLFLQELREFEQKGQLPHLMVMLLPDDHTAGTNPGAPTTRAMVADNDLALGRVVEALSKSRFWRETTIFVVEDDAQNGVDHVDGHRTVALCVSPYTRRGAVVSDLYTQVSMVATIERILGLPPMNQLDLAAPLMTTCFTKQATLAPYAVRPARIRLDEMNPAMNVLKGKQREWARQSMQQNFTIPDAADEEVLDRIIWHSVKGVNTPYPAGKGRARPGSSVEPGAD